MRIHKLHLVLLLLLPATSRVARGDPPSVTWIQRSPAISPPARLDSALAYDRSRGVSVLFGGLDGTFPYLSDIWEWNSSNGTWTQRSPPNRPTPRYSHTMAYDLSRGVTVLFGGQGTGGVPLNDTWEWNGTFWGNRLSATSPAARAGQAMAYDSVHGVTMLFGGAGTPGTYFNDTWEWNGTNWTQRFPATSPSMRDSSGMAFDSARGVMVLFGGLYADTSNHFLGDTWEWNGTNWTQRNPTTSPQARFGFALTYDSIWGVTMLFGGYDDGNNYLDDTWEWDGTSWSQCSAATHPSARYLHAMTYDSSRAATVLFGGSNLANLGDTWEMRVLPDGDINLSGETNGLDVSAFVTALLAGSTAPSDLTHADFNRNGIIDEGDVPGFTLKLLGF